MLDETDRERHQKFWHGSPRWEEFATTNDTLMYWVWELSACWSAFCQLCSSLLASARGERDLKSKMELCLSNQKLVQWYLCATGLWVELFHVHQCSAPAYWTCLCKGDEQRVDVTLLDSFRFFFSLVNSNYLATDTEQNCEYNCEYPFIHWCQLLRSSPQKWNILWIVPSPWHGICSFSQNLL